MTSLSLQLAEFLSGISPDTLNPRLLHHARRYMVDYLGVAAFGATTPWATVARRDALRSGGAGGRASLLGSASKTSAHAAAFANGAAGHAFELDDVHDETISHPGAVIYPAVFALAETEGIAQDHALAAVVAGYEAIGRVGLASGPWAHMSAGFHPTGTFGVFGAAAACASLLGLNPRQMNNALGLAASFASGVVEFSQTGGQNKRFHAGQAAASGLRAAWLAADGAEGPLAGLDGRYGFCRTFSPEPVLEALVADLGRRFIIDEVTVKPYPSCSDVHALIEAATAIRGMGVAAGDVASIRGRAPSKVVHQNMIDGRGSVMDAQYSAGFQIAIALTRDPRDVTIYTQELLADPLLARLQDLVTIDADPAYDAVYARFIPGALTIETRDGRSFTQEVETALGSPHRPMSDADIAAKFASVTASLIGESTRNEVLDEVWAFGTRSGYDVLSAFAREENPPR